jgi:lysophospholipase L1-like esterase
MRLAAVIIRLAVAAAAQTPAPSCASPAQISASSQAAAAQWADLAKYRQADAEFGPPVAGKPRVVFFGDSITEFWKLDESFPGRPYLDRGISAQTTPQMRLRFCQDVVALKPAAVLILAGTNDIAGNNGPTTNEAIEGNIMALAELAKSSGIAAVLASVLPAGRFPWKPEIQPVDRIKALNAWIKDYAAKNKLVFLDYYSALNDGQGGLKAGLSDDGVHPNQAGYAVMAPLAQEAIDRALRSVPR